MAGLFFFCGAALLDDGLRRGGRDFSGQGSSLFP